MPTLDQVRQLAGADAQTLYEWTPPGRPAPNLHSQFCKRCGVRTFGRGDHGPVSGGGPFYFVNVAALDVDPAELAEAPTRYLDGRHDRYDRAPADTRTM